MLRTFVASGTSYLLTSVSLAVALSMDGTWKYPLFAPIALVALAWGGSVAVTRAR